MKKRVVWLALIALAVVLSGCRITVVSGSRIVAPSSLVGYTLVLTNSTRTGVLSADQETYHFKSTSVVLNASFDQARSWSYESEFTDTATVSVIFALDGSTDLIIECALVFNSKLAGTHQCEYVHRTSTIMLELTAKGSSEGTFRIEEIPRIQTS